MPSSNFNHNYINGGEEEHSAAAVRLNVSKFFFFLFFLTDLYQNEILGGKNSLPETLA